ncbi:hypothetical protein RHGRI_034190 [Rhododendron griersonianum]|uniref:Uncharacterized protein n=1 Tax=Rhododendron griersonianum TaxID=479676 RepID=A0AAV6HZI6_9ERIC|nr:hypothetical protein RHGRI_034190 [Rhododendron griersonianum]
MEIETYGTEVGEEFDYDDEDDVESEDLAALHKKLAEGDQEVARLNRENEKVVEELAGLEREKKELTELILRNDETIARLKTENSRTRCGIGYLSMYPGEKEVMVRRAIEEYVLRKRQELEAGKSEKEMPAATPNLSHLKI